MRAMSTLLLVLALSQLAPAQEMVFETKGKKAIVTVVSGLTGDSTATKLIQTHDLFAVVDCSDCDRLEFLVELTDKASGTTIHFPVPFEGWRAASKALGDVTKLAVAEKTVLALCTFPASGAAEPERFPLLDPK